MKIFILLNTDLSIVIQDIFDFFKKHLWAKGHPDFLGALMYGILLTIIAFSRKIYKWVSFKLRTYGIPSAVNRYRYSQIENTSKLRHKWNFQNQSLTELYIPVHFLGSDRNLRIELIEFIKQKIQNGLLRLSIVGEAGSGKSVALGAICQIIFKLKDNLLPVIIKCSEFNSVSNEENLEKLIVEKLVENKFCKASRDELAKFFVKKNLYTGSIVILIDGIDEVEKGQRFATLEFLNSFFKRHSNIPLITACRESVWKDNPNILSNIIQDVAFMADFTPLEVTEFIYKWKLPVGRTSKGLIDTIQHRMYLKPIIGKPLVLSIVCFLYSQIKRNFPDKRTEFYHECTDALLGKWDESKLLKRENVFDKYDKAKILSEIAYIQLFKNYSEDEISRNTIFSVLDIRVRSNQEALLNELVHIAELLIEVPPHSYKFPHRTFTEYFAAYFIYHNNLSKSLFETYQSDKGKWEETLRYFLGINTDSNITDWILLELNNEFVNTNTPNSFILKVLLDCQNVSSELAFAILEQAENICKHKIDLEIINCLGNIALSNNQEYREKIKSIFADLMEGYLPINEFQEILLILVRIDTPEIKEFVLKQLDKLDLIKFVINLGKSDVNYVIKILEHIPETKYFQIISGLKIAAEFEILTQLILNSEVPLIRQFASLVISSTSFKNEFCNDFENYIKKSSIPLDDAFDVKYLKYLTKKGHELQDKGESLLSFNIKELICSKKYAVEIEMEKEKLDNTTKFVVSAFLHEDGYAFYENNLFKFPIYATTLGLIYHYKKSRKLGSHLAKLLMVLIVFYNLSLSFNGGLIDIRNHTFLIQLILASYFILSFILYMYTVVKKTDLSYILMRFLNYFSPLFSLIAFSVDNPYSNEIKISQRISVISSIIFITTFILFIPLPFTIKLIDSILLILLFITCLFCSYLSPLAFIFQNYEMQVILGKSRKLKLEEFEDSVF